MLASTAEPFDSPDFLFEPKWDGFRCLRLLGKGYHPAQEPQRFRPFRLLPGTGFTSQVCRRHTGSLGRRDHPPFMRAGNHSTTCSSG